MELASNNSSSIVKSPGNFASTKVFLRKRIKSESNEDEHEHDKLNESLSQTKQNQGMESSI